MIARLPVVMFSSERRLDSLMAWSTASSVSNLSMLRAGGDVIYVSRCHRWLGAGVVDVCRG